jgi:hypothetical protein
MRLTYWVLIVTLVGAHFAGYSPIGVVFDILGRCWGALRPASSAVADDSLGAAIRNVTSDFDQVGISSEAAFQVLLKAGYVEACG